MPTLVEISVIHGRVRFEVQGADRLLGLKSRIEVPVRSIKSASAESDFPTFAGLRLLGTSIPGVMRIGSFYGHGTWTYWDARSSNRDRTISVELESNRYSRLVIEVPDPDEAIRVIESARATA